MKKPNFTFHHIALKCRDFEKSIAFYKAIGFTEYARWGDPARRIALLDMPGGGKFELFSDGGDMYSDMGKYEHIALATADVEGDYERALAAGAVSHIAPKTVEVDSDTTEVKLRLHLAFVKGPDGEQIEFIECTERS